MISVAGILAMCPRLSKRTAEEYYRIDVRVLHRRGYLCPGSHFTLEFSRGQQVGTIDGSAEVDYLVLIGVTEPGDMPHGEIVRLKWTSCNYGGMRPWFICPSFPCARRVAILYDTGEGFKCRRCCKLVYESQRLTIDRHALRQAQLITIGVASRRGDGEFPGRPKGMHRRTYQLLRFQADQMQLPPRIWKVFAKRLALKSSGLMDKNESR